jgi:MFS transporter, OFA family, oxalate/formate antiporter
VSGLFTDLSLLLSALATEAWQLLLSYSLLLAIGTGAVYGIAISTASRWFQKNRELSVGIASSGGGIGMLAMSPLVAYLIDTYDWRMAYTVIGVISLLLPMSFALLMEKDPAEIGLQPDGAKPEPATGVTENSAPQHEGSITLGEAIKTSQFWLIFFIWVFFSSVMHIGTTHAIPHAIDIGIPAIQASLILTIAGGAMIPGTFFFGAAPDKTGRKRGLAGCTILIAIGMAWLIFAQQLWGLYLFAVILGLTLGGLAATLSAMTSDIFGLRNIGVIMGFGVGDWAVGAAIGPYIAGFLFDTTQSYTGLSSTGP